jgi:hypothetical protein
MTKATFIEATHMERSHLGCIMASGLLARYEGWKPSHHNASWKLASRKLTPHINSVHLSQNQSVFRTIVNVVA